MQHCTGFFLQFKSDLLVKCFLLVDCCFCHDKLRFVVTCRVRLKRDGTRRRTGGEVKGKLANGVGSQYPSHYLGTRCIQHYNVDAYTSAVSSRLN
jgi:hypothetical protein